MNHFRKPYNPALVVLFFIFLSPLFGQKNSTNQSFPWEALRAVQSMKRHDVESAKSLLAALWLKPMKGEQAEHWDTWLAYMNLKLAALDHPDTVASLGHHLRSRFKQLGDLEGMHGTSMALANWHYRQGNYDSALWRYKEAEQLAWQIKSVHMRRHEKEALGLTWVGLSRVFIQQGEDEAALFHAFKAWNMADSLGMKELQYKGARQVAIIYNQLNQDSLHLHYVQQAYELAIATEDSFLIGEAINNLAIAYAIGGNLDQAKAHFKFGLAVALEEGNQIRVADRWQNVAIVQYKQGYFDSALWTFNRSLSIARNVGYRECEAVALTNMGDLYMKQEDYKEALKYARAGLSLSEEIGRDLSVMLGNLSLSKIYEGMGKPDSALKYYKIHANLRIGRINDQQHARMEILRAEFDAERQERQLAVLEKEKAEQALANKQKGYLIAILLGSFVALGVIALLLYRHHRLQSTRESEVLKQRLLRVQLNPHFMYNALNAIQQYMYQEDTKITAGDYLSRFSKLTRQILELNQHDFIPLSDELGFIHHYLQLQQIRLDRPFSFSVEVTDSLDTLEVAVPPMITQPFLENAIEHGLLHRAEAGSLLVKLARRGEQLEIVIEDDGVGRAAAALQQHRNHYSMATKITRDRLKYLGRTLRRHTKMVVHDLTTPAGEPRGTQVVFEIPITYA